MYILCGYKVRVGGVFMRTACTHFVNYTHIWHDSVSNTKDTQREQLEQQLQRKQVNNTNGVRLKIRAVRGNRKGVKTEEEPNRRGMSQKSK